MARYLHLYETEAQFDADYYGENYTEPWVSYTNDIERVDYTDYNRPEYVDLGLPSGTLWATCNVGASSPEEYGDYYAWGEIVPNKASAYTISNYHFFSPDDSGLTKYNTTDNKMTLDLEDDAANVVMGGNWHMPSKAQLLELSANTTSAWTDNYNGTGVAGAILTSKNNGNSIFFPAAGGISEQGVAEQGKLFAIWSSSRYPEIFAAYNMYIRIGTYEVDYWVDAEMRYYGVSIRGVLGELND